MEPQFDPQIIGRETQTDAEPEEPPIGPGDLEIEFQFEEEQRGEI